MPYRQGPLKGQLKLAEIKRLAKAKGLKYNYTQMAREDLIKRLTKDGYAVDHQGAKLVSNRKPPPPAPPPPPASAPKKGKGIVIKRSRSGAKRSRPLGPKESGAKPPSLADVVKGRGGLRKTPKRPAYQRPTTEFEKQLEARKQDMIKRGLRGPQGQLGTGVGQRWTLQDEIENLTR